jgi:Ca-activated chloride channel homolog
MMNRNWWILGASVLAIAGCGRPAAPEVAQGKSRVDSAIAKTTPAESKEGQSGAKDESPIRESGDAAASEFKSEAPPTIESRTAAKNLGDVAKGEPASAQPESRKRSIDPGDIDPAGGRGKAGGPPGGIGDAPGGPPAGYSGGIGGPPGGVGGVGGMGGIGAGGTPGGVAHNRYGEGAPRDRYQNYIGGEGEAPSIERDPFGSDNRFVPGGEAYEKVAEKKFSRVLEEPLSTFSIDVDTAAYSNLRRFLTQHALPPVDAVRIEELINYFSYDYAPPQDEKPFAANAEIAGCPWAPQHRLVRIGIKGKVIEDDARPVSNLVFLIDVSGSMQGDNRLPLVKHALRMLTEKLGENDRVAMVVYAGSSGLVLESTSGTEKPKILGALDMLQAGGSTNGAGGIQQAYEVAVANFIKGGVNRVILCTDGDFNVGITDRGQLVKLAEEYAKSGVFLSVLGFGMGNLKDATMEQLADKGNGNYAYIDTPLEAKKVLVDQMAGTLVTIAKDVKIQVEFNPAKAAAYRLVGYENRMLAAQDFTDDKKDAGEIGAGHTVTALYEVIPAGMAIPGATPALKYQKPTAAAPNSDFGDELMTVKLRYKKPDGDVSTELSFPLKDSTEGFGKASADFRWAASVAAFGMLLRNSDQKGDVTLEAVKEWAQTAVGADKNGYRREFIHLIDSAISLGDPTHLTAVPGR